MSLLLSISIILTSISILFTQMSHPLAMGITLLIQTILIAGAAGLSMKTTWFSYILFLIFLGAMLVLFIYVTSLSPNEPLSLSPPMTLILILGLATSVLASLMDPMASSTIHTMDKSKFVLMESLAAYPSLLNNIYNTTCMKMTVFLILYLLLTLVVVVKITSTHFGALRTN
uniref:NADH-ubiquinone oxidoreductase chain 6 n=1 Tax=Halocaridinides fowleri TaxID=2010950 RepID=A0A1Z2R7D6_9EUCA|nr:NADH dehydrogenase subunit 6 [Halocaridinides fowleri]ASA39629.1 NADH dehydrogenase subunit 6 [Halocaridinides fowleri]